ncbi:MAG: hypothetical protein K9M51_01420 [Candidatus Gracilibacteria bacterium]|nr:hypothetical protein [Candidatus Gracilibacteria bacterium]
MEPTHVYFDGQSIVFSENLGEIATFLIEIDKEVQSFLSREEQLENIRKQLLEYTGLVQVMAKTIQEANLDFHFQMSENPATIADKLKFNPHPRSEMIVLFAYLETLRCLWAAYELKKDDENDLRDAKDKTLEKFYADFCLSTNNKWVKENSKVSGKISKDKLRKLRNSLTHLFSVSGLCVVPEIMKDDSKKMMNATNNKALFISSRDLIEIIQGAFELVIKKWSDDYQDSLNNPNSEFEEKIKCTHSIVKKYGAILLRKNNSK